MSPPGAGGGGGLLAARRAEVEARANELQREATRPGVSAWVSASAGSGKTKVLIDRVLALLLSGAPPARLLCLTFTKAAAAEMSNRLAATLAGWATADDTTLAAAVEPLVGGPPKPETLARARTLFAQVLDVPGGMKIQTIHAFCQSVLGRFPLEAAVPPHFRVVDERSAAELLAAAREESVAGDDALEQAMTVVAAHAQEGRFTELLAELLKERGGLSRALAGDDGLSRSLAVLRRKLGLRRGESAEGVLEAGCADAALDLMGLRLAVEGLLQGSKTDRERGARLAAWLEADLAGRMAGLWSYLEAFFTGGGDGDVRARLLTKAALEAAPGADEILNQEAQRLYELRAALRAHAVFEATSALLAIGRAVLAAYERHKQARALLDYDDLILLTRDLLTGAPGRADWVLYKLDGGLDHVLIDEAQDTNPEQWQVIAELTAEFFAGEGAAEASRTVFAVGDPKQSIYGFQRADPEGFARMRDHFHDRVVDAGQVMREVPLDVSFRSTAAVLDTVDRVFAQPGAADGLFLGDLPLAHRPVRSGEAGLVELWPPADPLDPEDFDPWQPPGESAAALPPVIRLARLVARRIWHWTGDPAWADRPEAQLASKGRRLRPGDVMVLVRRRNVFVEALVRELKVLGVPVAGIDRMVLTEQLAVMDLIALGRALLLPDDDLTLATLLKSPLIGLDEDGLFDLAHGRDGSLWATLQARRDETPAFRAAHGVLAVLMARVDYQRPFELYAELLGAGGGRRRLVGRLGPDANDPIDEFLALAQFHEREHVPSLEGFLHWLEAGAQEVKRDLEHGGAAVRVMTVHGAKGLEAPVVILPDTLQTPQSDRGLLWLDTDGPQSGERLPLWPLSKAYDGDGAAAARERARRAREREYRRLLYVAMTRAEDRLYVCGWNTSRSAPEDCWHQMVERALDGYGEPVAFDFTGELEGGWSGPGWRLETLQAAEVDGGESRGEPEAPPEPLPDWAAAMPAPEPSPPRPLAPSRPTGPGSEEPPVASPLAGSRETRFRRGLLVHRLLQHLPGLPEARRAEAGARFLAQPLHALEPAEQAEILAEALGLLEHPETRELFGPESLAEAPLAGVLDGRGGPFVVTGQLDRLLVSDQSVWVIDYKTNRDPPASESEAPIAYIRQMASYRAVLQGVFPDRPVRCLLLWTVGPQVMQLSDALLARHAP